MFVRIRIFICAPMNNSTPTGLARNFAPQPYRDESRIVRLKVFLKVILLHEAA